MSSPIPSPPSPQSPSSDLSDSPPTLDPSTLALLNDFITSKTEQENRFHEIAARVTGLALDDADDAGDEEPIMSVDEYRDAFAEDWQLSQFWYTTAFAMRFARTLHALCTPDTAIAFVCCPTAFVAFQHTRPFERARLLDVDERFAVLAPRHYVHYDMEEPDALPDYMTDGVDIAVVDPPFLSEYTNARVVKTLRRILRRKAKLIVLTSTSVEPILERLYDAPPLGPLKRTKIEVQHGQLRNDFGCWASWEGAEDFDLEAEEEEEEKKE
ncbi:putative N6-adenine methyltransferase-domain-containing protein [Mycena pura]|uniref:N6-adenine methyltransferase-domain-containing protein n=1 Tax=Mycena pura TaxID=153505 RepID=A0AAD7E142_9AGAR|nr:putative N6-adenine methyltransferase-domain-containing protein [Mycena pura]